MKRDVFSLACRYHIMERINEIVFNTLINPKSQIF